MSKPNVSEGLKQPGKRVGKAYRILIIDDDKDFVDYQTILLTGHGYNVKAANTATQALLIEAEFKPQLALIDLVLDKENGIDVLDALLAKNQEICCLMITGREEIGSALLALRHGAVDYLSKSVSTDELFLALNRATEKIQLRQEKQEIEYVSRAKSEFLTRMSHELRTPMNAILGFGQLMQINNENFNDEQKEGIGHIMVAGRHLLQLINEVLDIAKVDAGEMSLSTESVSFNDVLDSALLLVKPLAMNNGVTIQPVNSCTRCAVMADIQRLKQVFVNLLSNAVKYNRKGGQVKIHCNLINKINSGDHQAMVHIAFTDTGVGIKRADHNKVFEPFQRVSLRGENIEGSGIGLTITKRMVELMDGNIGFESEYGKGSTFWIELPFAGEHETGISTVQETNVQIGAAIIAEKAKVILYIEDNPTNLTLVERILKKYSPYSLLSAGTAERGIDVAKEQKPDLILMDIDLPGMSGYEALDVLQACEETSHIPIIAVSAHAMSEHIEKGQQSAFKAYVTKPIDVNELLRVLDEY